MIISIYQAMNPEAFRAAICGEEVPFSEYDLVYQRKESPLSKPANVRLEELFTEFNIEHPADYKGRSLSVGDVVVFTDEDENEQYFRVASFGFKEFVND